MIEDKDSVNWVVVAMSAFFTFAFVLIIAGCVAAFIEIVNPTEPLECEVAYQRYEQPTLAPPQFKIKDVVIIESGFYRGYTAMLVGLDHTTGLYDVYTPMDGGLKFKVRDEDIRLTTTPGVQIQQVEQAETDGRGT